MLAQLRGDDEERPLLSLHICLLSPLSISCFLEQAACLPSVSQDSQTQLSVCIKESFLIHTPDPGESRGGGSLPI